MDSRTWFCLLSQNQEQFENKSVAELLNRLSEKKHISKAALPNRPGGAKHEPHQIFAGRRNPSRNRLRACVMGLKRRLIKTQGTAEALWNGTALSEIKERCHYLLWIAS